MFLKCVLWIQSILLLTSSTETHEFLLLNQVILSTEKKKESALPSEANQGKHAIKC